MSNSANRYYAEGVIKELWMATKEDASETGNASETEVRFTLTPDKEYAIEAEHKGEKKTCPVFRQEDCAEHLCGNGVADLYAGDFTFSALQGMTFDQLLLIKINGCHVRIFVEAKTMLATRLQGAKKGKLNKEDTVQVSEIRLNQK